MATQNQNSFSPVKQYENKISFFTIRKGSNNAIKEIDTGDEKAIDGGKEI